MHNKYTYQSQRSYYMPGANAVAPEYYEEANNINYQENTRPEDEQKKKIGTLFGKNIGFLATVFVLATLIVGQYVYIAGLGYNIVRAENQLNAVLSSNEKLKQQYANLGDLAVIEDYAVNNLGMVKATDSMAYVAQSEPLGENTQSEAGAEESGILRSIVSGVLGFFKAY